MNPIAKALQEVIRFLAEYLPESARPFVDLVANLLGGLDIPISDPRMAQVAQLVAELIVDLNTLGAIEDANVAQRARLLAENRFTRAWRELGLEGV